MGFKKMKKLVILGGGTAGTLMANKFRKALSREKWKITIIDKEKNHYYQPGFLFIPFGIYRKEDVIKPKRAFYPKGVEVLISEIDKVEPDKNRILLINKQIIDYDFLIVATGSEIRPDEVKGMTGKLWRKSIFDFYTLDGAIALRDFFNQWEGGRLVVNIAEMPIKCPVAPLEFLFLADDFFKKRGLRDKVDITFVTPLSGAFTKPVCSEVLGGTLEKKKIKLETEFAIGEVDNKEKKIISWDEREVPFDVLVTVPTNMGSRAIQRSGMGDELNFIPTDKHTLQSKSWENIFVIGDATDIPTSKAGSVAHFEGEIVFQNMMDMIAGRPPSASFDGHANCFIESGSGKGMLVDFNYDTEPLPGKFPIPVIGPFSLLEETVTNHWGKLMFKWLYWNAIIKGREIPFVGAEMSMSGKQIPKDIKNNPNIVNN